MGKILYPKQIILEVTAHCNLRCKGCAFHGPDAFTKRSKGSMKEEVWQKIITEIAKWPSVVNLTTHGGGEPLLHPDLLRILSTAKRYQNIKVGFLTNATLLTEDWAKELIALKIDWIAFSVDGVEPKSHAEVRRGSNLTNIEHNIIRFLEIARDRGHMPDVLINMVLYPEVKEQSQSFLKKWLGRVRVVRLSPYRYPPSSRRWPGVAGPRRPCELLWSQAVVAWDGRVGLCCEDMDINVPLGNVLQSSVISIWNGTSMERIRRLHKKGAYDEIPLCKECDTWADEPPQVVEDVKRGLRIVKRASGTEYSILASETEGPKT